LKEHSCYVEDLVTVFSLAEKMRKERKLEKKRECSKEIANTLGKYVISMTRPIYLRRDKPYNPLHPLSPDSYGQEYGQRGVSLIGFKPCLAIENRRPGGCEVWILPSGRFLEVKTKSWHYDDGLVGGDGTVYRPASISWVGDCMETDELSTDVLSDGESLEELTWSVGWVVYRILQTLDIKKEHSAFFKQFVDVAFDALSETSATNFWVKTMRDDCFVPEMARLFTQIPFSLVEENAEKVFKSLLTSSLYGRGQQGTTILRKLSERRPELLEQELKSEHEGMRYAALSLLKGRRDVETMEILIEALRSEFPDVRCGAIRQLGRIGTERVIGLLIQALKDENEAARWLAAEALGRIGSEEAVVPLTQMLSDEEDKCVLRHVVIALNRIGPNEDAVVPLLQIWTGRTSFLRDFTSPTSVPYILWR